MNAATHPIAPEEVMAFLDGELPAAHAQSVSDHLKFCPDCSNLAAQLGETKRQLAGWQVESLPTATETEIYEASKKLVSYRHDSWFPAFLRLNLRQWRPLALGAAALFLILFVFGRYSGRSTRLGKTIKEGASDDGVTLLEQKGVASPSDRFSRMDVAPLETHSGSLGDKVRVITKSSVESNGVIGGGMGDETSEENSRTPAPPATPTHQPMIARSVSLVIITNNFASSRASLEAILARHHGYSAQLNASTSENAQRSITASLRVPANELAAALAELKILGHVENESQSGEEVTQLHADLVARLKNSRETEQRLQAILLQRTGKIADVLAVEEEISRVRGEIEEMEAEQKSLEHRVDFATIELHVSEEYKAQLNNSSPSASTRIHNSLVAGYKNAAETLLGFVLFFAESGPTLLIWLVILLVPAFLLIRRFRRAAAVI